MENENGAVNEEEKKNKNKKKEGSQSSKENDSAKEGGEKPGGEAGKINEKNESAEHPPDDPEKKKGGSAGMVDNIELEDDSSSGFNDENLFTRSSEPDEGFTIWSADVYFHKKFANVNVILRFLIEAIIFTTLLLGPIGLILLGLDKLGLVYNVFEKDENNTEPWLDILRFNIFVLLCYYASTVCSIVFDSFLTISNAFLRFFGLYSSELLWSLVQSMNKRRNYAHLSITFFAIFFLSNLIYGEYSLPQLAPSDWKNISKTLAMWAGIYMGILFIVKVLVNFSTFSVRRSAYADAIYALNYKLFVFIKLYNVSRAISKGESVANACEECVHEHDDGMYLRYSTFPFGSPEKAKNLVAKIFRRLNKKELQAEDIKRFFSEKKEEVFKYLSGSDLPKPQKKETQSRAQDSDAADSKEKTTKGTKQTHRIRKERVTELAVELSNDRKDMEKTLRGRDSVFDKLELILGLVATIGAFAVLLFLFNVNPSVFMASFGTSVFTFSWIFADSIKNIYNCFIFLLIVRPYNIGDKVIVNGEILFVHRIDLLTTTFLTRFRKLVYITNPTLITSSIYNIARSPAQCEAIELQVDERTSYEMAIVLEKKVVEKMKKLSALFDGCSFRKISKGRLVYELYHTTNFQNTKNLRYKRNKAIRLFKAAMKECGIKHEEAFEFFE